MMTDEIDELIEEHWQYTLKVAELLYKEAMKHGIKHGIEIGRMEAERQARYKTRELK